jgi:hypothetical protein
MTQRRYYFQIRSVNVIECIWADSLTEAKLKAADEWLPLWNQIEWLHSDTAPTLSR